MPPLPPPAPLWVLPLIPPLLLPVLQSTPLPLPLPPLRMLQPVPPQVLCKLLPALPATKHTAGSHSDGQKAA
jgi:hypothetical protein